MPPSKALVELPGQLSPVSPTPPELRIVPLAHGVVRASWELEPHDCEQVLVLVKYLPFPGKLDTAHDVEWNAWRERALKIIHKRIQDVGDLDSTYVLKPFGYKLEEAPCVVVPRTEGGNILQYVISRPELSIDEKLVLLLRAARCVNYLHTREPPVVHGGIHPTQFLIERERRPILFDFGIVNTIVSLPAPPSQATVTPSNPRGGYYAPEILQKASPTPAIDVFAFAGVILSVMSGRHPHDDYPVPMVAWLSGKPSPGDHSNLPETDPLWFLMNQMWEPKSSDRPNMTRVVSFLEGLVRPWAGFQSLSRDDEAHVMGRWN
ncbi:hypothetical protein FRB90_012070 [Tulasnella sp. 427]|nr:hypothetical protein FRB90_012070 [Tulasnella sp. 427]